MGHFALSLSHQLDNQGWKVKIRTRERVEPPHVTIIRGTRSWRYDVRRLEFMDRTPPPGDVPDELLEEIHENLDTIRRQWNAAYPYNPV